LASAAGASLAGVDSANAVTVGASTLAGAIGTRRTRLGVEAVRSATGSTPESTGVRARRFQSKNPVNSIASNETTTAKIDIFVFGFISTPFTIHPTRNCGRCRRAINNALFDQNSKNVQQGDRSNARQARAARENASALQQFCRL
jgi:hypothetical protein